MSKAPDVKPRALVVDDNADAAETFADLLGLLGVEATFTTDSRAALDLAEQTKPHIGFLDIAMPHINGYKLSELLRERYGRDLCLVAVTAYGQPEDRRRSRIAGFDAHVAKPADIDVVRSILSQFFPDRSWPAPN